MKVIRPRDILANPVVPGGYAYDIISTTLVNDAPNWDMGTTYGPGSVVIHINTLGKDNGKYRSLTTNTSEPPATSDAHWVRLGPSNKMAMFDSTVSTQSVSAVNTIAGDIRIGLSDTIAFLNVIASTISITVTSYIDPGAPVIIHTATKSLMGDTPIDWYDYFYFELEDQRTQAIFENIPLSSGDTRVSFMITTDSPYTGTAKAGHFVCGTSTIIGKTDYGLTAGIIDYSSKETDEYGNTELLVRDFSKRITAEVQVENLNLNKAQRVLYSLRATPALWLATSDARYEETGTVFGFYRDFSVSIAYPTHSKCSLEIEGLI